MTLGQSRIVIITGAAGTIGRAAAQLLHQQGWALMLADRDAARLEALAKTLPGSRTLCLDVADAKAVKQLFESVGTDLFAVVLAAGIEGPIGALEYCADEAFEEVMRANVLSVWLGLKHALPILKKAGRGSIVALSSISGVQGAAMMSPYAASKHAVTGLVRSAAREAASSAVRINALCPGPVASDMMNRIDTERSQSHPELLGGRKDASHAVPMQRYAKPEEIAQMIAFLCSDASSYTTGATLMVDGGITGK